MTAIQLRSEFHQLIDGIKDNSKLKIAYKLVHGYLLKQQEIDWNEIPEDLRASLELSIKQADKGKLVPYEKVKKQIKKRLNA